MSFTAIGGNTYTSGGTMPQQQFGASGVEVTNISSGISAGGMRGIGLVAFMVAQIALQQKINSLARDYYNTNRQDFQFWTNTHRGHMQASAQEAFNPVLNPLYQPEYTSSAAAGISQGKEALRAWYEVRRRAPRYQKGLHRQIDADFAILTTHAIASGWAVARRYEDAWTDAHNDRHYARKFAVANVGIGAGNASAHGLATAVGRLQESRGQFSDQIATIGNGFFRSRGTEQGATDTRERAARTTGVNM